MKLNPFPPELRTAARVSRWNILLTYDRDNVAQHSFFVAWYAFIIAKVIDWKGPLDTLLVKALEHDLDETVTADITGPVKKSILRDDVDEYIDGRMQERMGGLYNILWEIDENTSEKSLGEIQKIVDAADLMDAAMFLITNVRMGNQAAIPTVDVLKNKLEAAWLKLPTDDETKHLTWNTVALPALKAHYVKGGCGI